MVDDGNSIIALGVVTAPSDLLPKHIIELGTKASHSRFPVVGENVDNVIGILLAKDLLPLIYHHSLNIRHCNTCNMSK